MDIWVYVVYVVFLIFFIMGVIFAGLLIFLYLDDHIKKRRFYRKHKMDMVRNKLDRMAERLAKHTKVKLLMFKNGTALIAYEDDKDEQRRVHVQMPRFVGIIDKADFEDLKEGKEGLVFIYGVGYVYVIVNDK